MKVKLLSITPDAEKLIEYTGRVCYNSTSKITKDSYKSFIQTILKNGHESVIESASATFEINEVSRSLLAQITRHRLASFLVKSQRYCNENNFGYIIPDSIKNNKEAYKFYINLMEKINITYNYLVDLKIPKEDARMILSNSCHTKIILTANFRQLRHMIILRTSMKCYDKETEILTAQGWKYFKDLKGNEWFYSLNLKNIECELVKSIDIIEENYKGEMKKIKAQSIDLLVTPNHKNLVSFSYENKKFKLVSFKNLINKKMILMKKNCNKIKGKKSKYFNIPSVFEKKYNFKNKKYERIYIPSRQVLIKDLFRFVGFYLSDGWVSEKNKTVGICKGDKKKILFYKKILKRLTNNNIYFSDKGNVFTLNVIDFQLMSFLKPLGKCLKKQIPNFVWDYDFSILKILFNGLTDGDYAKESNIYYTSSKQLADDFQRLCLHLGFSASIGVDNRIGIVSQGHDKNGKEYKITQKNINYRISVNKKKNEPIIKTTNRNPITTEKYNNKIYCVELEKNNIVYIRRNGYSVWSGNSQWEIRNLFKGILEILIKECPIIFSDLKLKKEKQ